MGVHLTMAILSLILLIHANRLNHEMYGSRTLFSSSPPVSVKSYLKMVDIGNIPICGFKVIRPVLGARPFIFHHLSLFLWLFSFQSLRDNAYNRLTVCSLILQNGSYPYVITTWGSKRAKASGAENVVAAAKTARGIGATLGPHQVPRAETLPPTIKIFSHQIYTDLKNDQIWSLRGWFQPMGWEIGTL